MNANNHIHVNTLYLKSATLRPNTINFFKNFKGQVPLFPLLYAFKNYNICPFSRELSDHYSLKVSLFISQRSHAQVSARFLWDETRTKFSFVITQHH